MEKPDPTLIASANACTEHARDLVSSANAVFASGQVNIAYHLGVVAIEELGKRNLLIVESVARDREIPPSWPKRHALDHQQKLFWAFFGGNLFRNHVSRSDFEETKSLSRSLHLKRLAALYVEAGSDGLSVPKLAVNREETERIVSLADTLVKMAENEKPREEIPEEELERQRWFLSAIDDPEQRAQVFSKRSLTKLAEIDDAGEWADWIRSEIRKSKKAGAAAVARELERSKSLPEKGTRPKWRVRFRIRSDSHSIRPNAFTDWNKTIETIKLSAVSGRKKELIADITVYDQVPLEHLYHHSWSIARLFVVALNIATQGFFWWVFSEDKKDWYERVDDLDDNTMHVKIEQGGHAIDWGKNLVLTADDMKRAKIAFAAIPKPMQPDRNHDAMDAYISGLTYLAASDVHLPVEGQAVSFFVRSLRHMMKETGEWTEGKPFEPAFSGFVSEMAGDFDGLGTLVEIIRALDQSDATGNPANGPRPEADSASAMKMFVDLYFLSRIQPIALSRLAKEAGEAA